MKHLLIIVFAVVFGGTVMAQDLELKPQASNAHHDSINVQMARGIANAITGPKDTSQVIHICCGGLNQPQPMFIVKVHQKSFLLDTAVYGDVLGNINPDAIKNIEVLKDAPSYQKYGNAAKYGVIIVTLKDEKYSDNFDEFKGHIKRIEL